MSVDKEPPMMTRSQYFSDSPTDWRLEQAMWAYWCRDMDKVYKILTRVCLAEVTEDEDYEQTQQAAY